MTTLLTCNLLLQTFGFNTSGGIHRPQLLCTVWHTENVNCHTCKIERQHKLISGLQIVMRPLYKVHKWNGYRSGTVHPFVCLSAWVITETRTMKIYLCNLLIYVLIYLFIYFYHKKRKPVQTKILNFLFDWTCTLWIKQTVGKECRKTVTMTI